ncbi:MAG: YgjV family protein [Lachnospiraceae bacterium]|nr:YgjV family protein [Lachnospiraceae bacterium]
MNPWFIAAQALGIITILFEFVSYQIKDKVRYFLVAGIGSFFWALMFVSMGMASGMATQQSLIIAAGFSSFRAIVFFFIFRKDTEKSRKIGKTFLLCMVAIAVAAGIFTVATTPPEVRIWHIFGMIGALSFVVGQYLPGVHWVRVTVVIYATAVLLTQTPLNILYGPVRWNFMGIAIESAKIISVIIFYIRYARNKDKEPQTDLKFANLKN